MGRIATDDSGAREVTGRTRRLATAGLVGVVLLVSGFAQWAAHATAHSAQRAISTNRLSDGYARAARAVAAEESLERKYRLEPGPEVRARYDAAAAELLAALEQVTRDGSPADQAAVARVRTEHGGYLNAIAAMFAAVDRADTATALQIDDRDVDPSFGLIERLVEGEAERHHQQALDALAELGMLETFISWATPATLLAGMLLVALFSSVLRRVQRQLNQQRERAVHSSLHDELTGLPNRSLLTDRFEQALRTGRRRRTAAGLLLLDLDRFKEVNETFGHQHGDDLLQQIGPRLSAALRETDTIGRLGGDEFAILLPDVEDAGGAELVAERLRASLTEPFVIAGVELNVEASIGVAVSGIHGTDAMALMQRAEIAMYLAKKHSVGVCSYSADLDRGSPGGLALLGQLRRGLDRDELVLHYQPKINLRSGRVCGVEALVRWQHPERGLIPPDQFIPLAEHTGLIKPLTHSVLDTALAQVRSWAAIGLELPVAVNLSARNLVDEHLYDEVAELLAKHGVPAHLLELEVTETTIMTEPVRAARLLTRLHGLGVRIAIDDFGAGYTSLAQLRALPVTDLKVDRSFVMTMDRDPGNALIVHSVVELGHNLGLTAIAEGVETQQSMSALADYGCDSAQGYRISRPLPADAFLEWHARWDPSNVAEAVTAEAGG
ncbi:MAG: bifunctional diguanylate cyclase/phosphodiesterase [Actinobacteria bacterium]|nr:bifunctional diguanylate cyclase/phosphodiesterase [Actinomycetota bacterium]MBI3686734.1 bifunctional diguanylate cyclase/phosphodiesterase [Actinomycetota bacterium]